MKKLNKVIHKQPNKVIYKYPLQLTDAQELRLPEGAEILSVGISEGQVVVWAHVNPSNTECYVPITIAGTGNPLEIVQGETKFLGTVIQTGQWGNLVWHVFEGLYRTPF